MTSPPFPKGGRGDLPAPRDAARSRRRRSGFVRQPAVRNDSLFQPRMPMTLQQSPSAPSGASAFEAQSLEVALTVRDLDASVNWYRDIVGFAVEREYHFEGRLRAVAMSAG